MVEILVTQQPGSAAAGERLASAIPLATTTTAATAPTTTQQIIVIPQSLLQQQQPNGKKPILRVSPSSIAPVATVISGATARNGVNMSTTKVSLKRPLPPLASVQQEKKVAKLSPPLSEETSPPVRKRANLDHLTPEEKLMRRKLKNRVAAQNARDKKRARVDEMEEVIRQLQEENQALKDENEQLASLNRALSQENNQLRMSPLSPAAIKEEMPPSPLSLPRSPLPPSPVSPQMSPVAPTTAPAPPPALPAIAMPSPASLSTLTPGARPQQDQTVVVSRVGEPAEPTPVLLPKGQAREMAAEQAATAITAAACLVWTCLQAALPASSSEAAQAESASRPSEGPREQQPKSAASPPPAELPLKKRSSQWWGCQQRCWSPPPLQQPTPT